MKISDALVFALKSLDVRYVFGVSGANIEHLHDSIARLGNGSLEAILAKSESGAAFMADAHARVHNRIGVLCTTSGGGMLNALPGIAEAYSEGVPMLAIIGQSPLALEGRGAFQDSSFWGGGPNALDLFKSTTKYTHKLERASDFWNALDEAIRIAHTGRQGPVALLIPRDLYDQEVPDVTVETIQKWRNDAQRHEQSPSDEDRLFDALSQAKKPVLWLGHGVCRSHEPSSVTQFALRTGIPTVTTMSARQVMPHDAKNYLGMVGNAGHPSVHNYICDEADLIIAVGTGLSVMARGPTTAALAKKKIISVNLDESAILRVVPHAEIIRADAGLFFKALNHNPRVEMLRFEMPPNYACTVLKPVDAPYSVNPSSQNSTLRQSEAVTMIESIFPENGHILFDAGNCAAAALHWTNVPKGSTSTIALGMGTMGYAVGGAIGAQLGSKSGTRTVSIIGDGAFLMSGLEIHTALELDLPILFVVFNNAGHGMCVTRQQLYFEGRKAASTYHDFSIAKVAEGLAGNHACFVASAETPSELEAALSQYMRNPSKTGILEIRNYREEWPPFSPFYKEVGPVIKKGK
jgi:acetolactate synthase-1/2/3 large subunit